MSLDRIIGKASKSGYKMHASRCQNVRRTVNSLIGEICKVTDANYKLLEAAAANLSNRCCVADEEKHVETPNFDLVVTNMAGRPTASGDDYGCCISLQNTEIPLTLT